MNEYYFSDLAVGKKEAFTAYITKEKEDMFRSMTGDCNPLHQDDNFALEMGAGKYSGHVVFGMLTASFYSTLAGVYLPGRYSLIHSLEIKFTNPVYAGDELTVSGEIVDIQEALKLIQVKAKIKNQKAQIVSKANIKVLVLR